MKVLVVAELDGYGPDGLSHIRRTTLSAITFARHAIAARGGGSFCILALGSNVQGSELIAFGAERVIVVDDPSLATPLAECFARTIANIAQRGFDLIVATASSFGKDLLPRVAARLDAAYASDCVGVSAENDTLVYERHLFAGNALGYCQLTTNFQVVTARQSEFSAAETCDTTSPIETAPLEPPGTAASRVEFLAFDRIQSERPELTEARVVVAGGRGLREHFFDVLGPLARELGAAIGATRAACDSGLVPGDYQVGQTGKVVAPELYIAVGVSGAIQHVAGMKGSKVVVAIDQDPDAPIFEIADYGLVADLFTAVPDLAARIAARKAGR